MRIEKCFPRVRRQNSTYFNKRPAKHFHKLLSGLAILNLKKGLSDFKQKQNLLGAFATCLEFPKLLPGSRLFKKEVKLFLIYNLLSNLLVLSRVSAYREELARLILNFDQGWFESAYAGSHPTTPFPVKVKSAHDLVLFLFWVYNLVSQPMFNKTARKRRPDQQLNNKDAKTVILTNPVSAIKNAFGVFSMINLNDLVLAFHDFGLQLREALIPALLFRYNAIFANFPTNDILLCVRDYSTRPAFLLSYCIFLNKNGEHLKVLSLLKDLVMYPPEQMQKFH